MAEDSRRVAGERKALTAMVAIYCEGHHEGQTADLCDECRDLLSYADARLARCPHGVNKPTCNECTVHCYKPAMRERIRAVMRYAGPRMLTRHPVLAARHLARGLGHRNNRTEKVKS